MDKVISHPGSVRHIVDGQALVAIASGGCSACGHNAGKGGGCSIGKLAGNGRETLLALPAAPGLRVGDAVHVELSETQLTHAALFGYLLPILLLIAGALLGQALGAAAGTAFMGMEDAAAALGAAVGLVLGLFATRLHRPPSLRLVPPASLFHPVIAVPLEKSHV